MIETKSNRFGTVICVIAAYFLLLAVTGESQAEPNFFNRGKLGCGGYHEFRLQGTEKLHTHYPLKNFNDIDTIIIKKIRIYNADGTILYDSNDSGFPAGFNAILAPHQSISLKTPDVLNEPVGGDLQTVIEWEVKSKGSAFPLKGWTSLHIYDAATNEEKSRTTYMCTPLH